jgi:transcriptional regulator GlxA family with amidase domain
MNARLIDSGVLMGLGDPDRPRQLRACTDTLRLPGRLEQLAQSDGTSRTRFAANFRRVDGMTPFDYPTTWRLGIAQTMLCKVFA